MNPIPSADSDAWNLAQGSFSGRPTLVRYRPGLQSFCGDPSYPRRLTIKWSYEEMEESGMPTNEQSEELGIFEDSLQKALDPDRIAILSFVFTSAGVREWNYYVKDMGEVDKRINAALTDCPDLPIDLEAHSDPDWAEFRNVLLGSHHD